MTLPLAILAGGLATRLRPLTETVPKALVDVAGKPFVVRQIDLLRSHGLKHIVLCLGYLGEMVQAVVGDGSQWGVEVKCVFDGDKLLGTGGALRNALPVLGERFFVMYGDAYLDCDYAAVEEAFIARGKLGLMTVLKNNNQWDSSNVLFRNGRILVYDKRNLVPEMVHIDYGLGVLNARVFDAYPADTALDLAGIYQDLIARGELTGFEVDKRFYEIGSPKGLEETREYFINKERQQ